MPMTPEEIARVQGSFAMIAPIAQDAAGMFYHRLFVLDPALKPLFKGDLKAQGRKLMAMIGTAVGALDRLETIVPAVREMGRRHATYGVLPAHYATVGEALLWTLQGGLGTAFTPETRAAWTTCYTLLAAEMQAGAAA